MSYLGFRHVRYVGCSTCPSYSLFAVVCLYEIDTKYVQTNECMSGSGQ